MVNKRIILTAALLGFIAVILGAFGAHTLKEQISPGALEIWSKGVEYQFYHVLALLFLSVFPGSGNKFIRLAYWFFTIGIFCFCGSLYLLATRTISHIGFVHIIGPITPLGGLFFILGWAMLFFAALKHKDAA